MLFALFTPISPVYGAVFVMSKIAGAGVGRRLFSVQLHAKETGKNYVKRHSSHRFSFCFEK